jgi:catechol 2,3-dioxygenase-like lactoylglutathione lyase family enzyme
MTTTPKHDFTVKHIHLPVSDRRATIAFFERYFAFREEYDVPRGEAPPATVIRSLNGFQLTLENSNGLPDVPSWFHLGLLVPNPAACRTTYDKMVEDGVRMISDWAEGGKYTTFICEGPDGYGLQVYWDPAEMPLAT